MQSIRITAQVLAHEIAHMWFGDLVTMKWWDDLWLNEGFATLMMHLCVETVLPELSGIDFFLQTQGYPGFVLDSLRSSHPINVKITSTSQINEVFDAISYNKAAYFLRMVMNFMGADSFRNGVSHYLKSFQYSNADYQDFLKAVQTASKDLNLLEIAQEWLLEMNFPCVSVEKTAHGFRLTQSKFLRLDFDVESSEIIWKIPLTMKRINSGKVTIEKILMDGKTMDIPHLTPDEIIIVNSGAYGFFFAVYENDILDNIANIGNLLSDEDYFSLIVSQFMVVIF